MQECLQHTKEETISESGKRLGLYVHIPFCMSKCFYCDFLSFGGCGEEEMEVYTAALEEEIRFRGKGLAKEGAPTVDSVFLGGGTPSVLPVSMTRRILNALYESFSVAPDAEITTEVNPGLLDEEKLNAYQAMGINRLSMGVQTLDPDLLKALGRVHTVEDFERNFRQARECGFTNINVDLIFALPGQTVQRWMDTVEGVLELGPEHLSFYGLQIEENTKFYDLLMRGEITQASDETDRCMYHRAMESIRQAGYFPYEISNAAKGGDGRRPEGYRCVHNLKYWSMENYLGLGLGAHSYWREAEARCGRRFSNSESMKAYLEAAWDCRTLEDTSIRWGRRDPFVFWEHENSEEEERSDYFFTEFRRLDGISEREFRNRFDAELLEEYGTLIQRFEREGLLEVGWVEEAGGRDRRVYLSSLGLDLANTVIRGFISEH